MGCYGEGSANGAIWVPKTSDFQSGHRVVNNMLHIWYYVYVRHKMWFNTQNITKDNQNIKIAADTKKAILCSKDTTTINYLRCQDELKLPIEENIFAK